MRDRFSSSTFHSRQKKKCKLTETCCELLNRMLSPTVGISSSIPNLCFTPPPSNSTNAVSPSDVPIRMTPRPSSKSKQVAECNSGTPLIGIESDRSNGDAAWAELLPPEHRRDFILAKRRVGRPSVKPKYKETKHITAPLHPTLMMYGHCAPSPSLRLPY